MNENWTNYLLCLPISIGSIVFLIQQTDFIYEYGSLLSRVFKIKILDKYLKFEQYEKNSINFENYIIFLGSVYGVKKNTIGFICRLLTCFICLNCFLSVICIIILTHNLMYIFPCFFISILIFYILFSIKRSIFSSNV